MRPEKFYSTIKRRLGVSLFTIYTRIWQKTQVATCGADIFQPRMTRGNFSLAYLSSPQQVTGLALTVRFAQTGYCFPADRMSEQ